MKNSTRREALKTMLAGGAGLLATVNPLTAQTPPIPSGVRAFQGKHQPKQLPFDPAKLNGISEKLIRSHWENNYGGAVKALNVIEQRLETTLKEKDLPAFVYGDLKREELLRTGSVVLHELYFGNLGGDGKVAGPVTETLTTWFGSVGQWEAEFTKTAMALSGGSGWVVLAANLHTGEFHNYWAWDHMHQPPGSLPLLVLDLYEHAYQMDYGAAAAKYVEAFFKNINWEVVNRRAQAALKFKLD
ncbi:MAG: superoxide dismutase [Blastocatellia bacterium]|nr:superoxide dismutase [Blastocatellia bacterium]